MEQISKYIEMTYGPGAAILGLVIARSLWKLAPAIFDMILEMRMLRADLVEVKKYGSRIDKLENDVDHQFKKQRVFEERMENLTKENGNEKAGK